MVGIFKTTSGLLVCGSVRVTLGCVNKVMLWPPTTFKSPCCPWQHPKMLLETLVVLVD